MDVSSGKLNITLATVKIELTLAVIALSSSMANRIQTLDLRMYVAFEEYASAKFVSYSAYSYPRRNMSSSANYTFTFTGLSELVLTGTPRTFAYFTGLVLSATSTVNLFNLGIVVLQVNATAVNITLYSNSATPTYVDNVRYLWLSFDPGVINNDSFASFKLMEFGYSGSLSLVSA